jgi:hypothetical protein
VLLDTKQRLDRHDHLHRRPRGGLTGIAKGFWTPTRSRSRGEPCDWRSTRPSSSAAPEAPRPAAVIAERRPVIFPLMVGGERGGEGFEAAGLSTGRVRPQRLAREAAPAVCRHEGTSVASGSSASQRLAIIRAWSRSVVRNASSEPTPRPYAPTGRGQDLAAAGGMDGALLVARPAGCQGSRPARGEPKPGEGRHADRAKSDGIRWIASALGFGGGPGPSGPIRSGSAWPVLWRGRVRVPRGKCHSRPEAAPRVLRLRWVLALVGRSRGRLIEPAPSR